MSDELVILGKSYVSSKQAAVTTGYAQDYIGQLARAGLIDAQRVGGLWYVDVASLVGYKANTREIKAQPLNIAPARDPESLVSFDGKDYISASRAAKITSYNQDYIGQLARSGKILSRQIGNRWYVERDGLLAHKKEKDGLLAAVQRESVGLRAPIVPIAPEEAAPIRDYVGAGPVLTYFKDETDLLPAPHRTPSPIKVMPRVSANMVMPASKLENKLDLKTVSYTAESTDWLPEQSMHGATKALIAFTIVIVLSYGLVSLKTASTYAEANSAPANNAYMAAAANTVAEVGDLLESLLTRDISFERPAVK